MANTFNIYQKKPTHLILTPYFCTNCYKDSVLDSLASNAGFVAVLFLLLKKTPGIAPGELTNTL